MAAQVRLTGFNLVVIVLKKEARQGCMAQIFHPSTNTIAKLSIVGTLIGIVTLASSVPARRPIMPRSA